MLRFLLGDYYIILIVMGAFYAVPSVQVPIATYVLRRRIRVDYGLPSSSVYWQMADNYVCLVVILYTEARTATWRHNCFIN